MILQKKVLIGLLLAAVLSLAVLLLLILRQGSVRTIQEKDLPSKGQTSASSNFRQGNAKAQSSEDKQLADWLAKQAEERKKIEEEVAGWGKMPIKFYGKVLDEMSQSIEGASIDYSITDLSPEGRTMYHAKSKRDGSFLIENRQGKNLGNYPLTTSSCFGRFVA